MMSSTMKEVADEAKLSENPKGRGIAVVSERWRHVARSLGLLHESPWPFMNPRTSSLRIVALFSLISSIELGRDVLHLLELPLNTLAVSVSQHSELRWRKRGWNLADVNLLPISVRHQLLELRLNVRVRDRPVKAPTTSLLRSIAQDRFHSIRLRRQRDS
jgi:hypothetical protein